MSTEAIIAIAGARDAAAALERGMRWPAGANALDDAESSASIFILSAGKIQ
jgi:hypothetical protein